MGWTLCYHCISFHFISLHFTSLTLVLVIQYLNLSLHLCNHDCVSFGDLAPTTKAEKKRQLFLQSHGRYGVSHDNKLGEWRVLWTVFSLELVTPSSSNSFNLISQVATLSVW